ncbi:hypothetical protein S245_028063, partial [Arachis hypogaea]
QSRAFVALVVAGGRSSRSQGFLLAISFLVAVSFLPAVSFFRATRSWSQFGGRPNFAQDSSVICNEEGRYWRLANSISFSSAWFAIG